MYTPMYTPVGLVRGWFSETPYFTVPGDGFEPPTNGLQNRCSTTELTRHIRDFLQISFFSKRLG
jgi:hypothetical protein